MKTAFEILGVPEQVDDATVKRVYLQKVKQYPPEHATAQFQQIRAAYEAIKDARSRIKYQLFYCPDTDFDKLLEKAFETDSVATINSEQLIKLLQFAIKDTIKK